MFASSNALIQLSIPDHLRGRVMALFTICLHGMTSIGQMVMGSLADLLSATTTLALSAGILIALAGLIAFRLIRLSHQTE